MIYLHALVYPAESLLCDYCHGHTCYILLTGKSVVLSLMSEMGILT